MPHDWSCAIDVGLHYGGVQFCLMIEGMKKMGVLWHVDSCERSFDYPAPSFSPSTMMTFFSGEEVKPA